MMHFLKKAFSFNKAIKRPLAAYRIIPQLLKLEDRVVPVTGAFTSVTASLYAPLGVAEVTFSQIVTGVDKSDFELLKDGNPIDLTTAILSGSTSGGSIYHLSNLELLTNAVGSYTLQLKASGTGIADQASSALTGQPSVTWVRASSSISATADSNSTTANTSTTLTPLANDSNADGSGLRIYSSTPINPAQASLVQNADGTFTFQSAANGSFSFNYTATGQQTKVVASDAAANDNFGNAVAFSGDTIVVGAYLDDFGAVSNQGSAYVFIRSGSGWTFQQKLSASDGAANDYFGASVAISGDTIVIGASNDDIGASTDQGSAYVFTRSNGVWTQQAQLLGTSGAFFGQNVAVSGDTIAVVSRWNSNGFVSVFTREGTIWSQQQIITISGSSGYQGAGNQPTSLSLSNNIVAVGLGNYCMWIPDSNGNGVNTQIGAVVVYSRSGSIWSEQSRFYSSDKAAGITASFGSSVSLSGNTLAVGDQTIANQGATYIFTTDGSTWTQQAKLLAADGLANDQFGASVSLLGDTLLIGAPGDDVAYTDQGSVYIFKRSGSTWSQYANFSDTSGAASDAFGSSVVLAGDTFISGAPSDDATAANQGSFISQNINLATNTASITVGTVTVPVPLVLGITQDMGLQPNDGITNDQNLEFFGTSLNGYQIELKINGISIGTTTTDSLGNWTFNYSANTLASGIYIVTAIATDLLSNVSVPSLGFSVEVDAGSPTGTIGPVTTPRNSNVSSVSLAFNENVFGVDLADFSLTLNGTPLSLLGVTINGSGNNYSIGNISGLTNGTGTYVLTLNASGSGITDAAGNSLMANASTTWVLSVPLPPPPPPSGDTTPPTCIFEAVPSVGRAGLPQIAITFSESVTGFDISDILLTRAGAAVNIQGAVLTGSGSNYILQNLANLTYPIGEYHLQIKTSGTGITDLSGNALSNSNSADWKMVGSDNALISLRSHQMDGSMEVREANTNNSWGTFTPFPGYNGAVHLLKGNFMGDGKQWMVMAAGEGGAPHIVIMDPTNGQVLRSWFGYSTDFRGGLFIAVGDVNADGADDLITGPNAGGGPHIKVYDGKTNNIIFEFMAYDPSFIGGVSVALADVNNDGRLDIVTGTGKGGGPHVRVFDALNGRDLLSFMAYDPSFRGGVFVAAGDIDGNGTAEIVTGSGFGGTSTVRVFDLRTLQAVRSFMAYDPAFLGGVRVGLSDRNRDGILDIFTGPGPGGGPHIKVFDGVNLNLIDSYFAGSTIDPYGVYIN